MINLTSGMPFLKPNDMKNIANRMLLIIACLGIAGVSCNKSDSNAKIPTLELVSGDNLITKDTTAAEASTLHFKVLCKWNGENTLTNFIVSNNGTRVVDEGMNTKECEKDVSFAKSSNEVDSINFIIRDIKGHSANSSLIVKKAGSAGGDLIRYNSISLNAQNAARAKSFLSLSDGVTYTLQDAFGTQTNINMIYYYDVITSDANTIASPGANIDASIFSGTYGLSNWTTKNTTRFYQITLTQQQFDAITDPTFVVNSYSESSGKRKAKNLAVGDVYAFKVENTSKYGIFRVSEVTGQDAGNVVFSIVMQK